MHMRLRVHKRCIGERTIAYAAVLETLREDWCTTCKPVATIRARRFFSFGMIVVFQFIHSPETSVIFYNSPPSLSIHLSPFIWSLKWKLVLKNVETFQKPDSSYTHPSSISVSCYLTLEVHRFDYILDVVPCCIDLVFSSFIRLINGYFRNRSAQSKFELSP